MDAVTARVAAYHKRPVYPKYGFNNYRVIDIKDLDLVLVEKLLQFKSKYDGNPEVVWRHKYEGFSVFTNNRSIIDEISAFTPNHTVAEVIPAPAGVKWFAKKPRAKFRTYFSFTRLNEDEYNELVMFLARHPSIYPCKSVIKMMSTPHTKPFYNYLSSSNFLEYDDESYRSMLHLFFGRAVGKTFKLEKK